MDDDNIVKTIRKLLIIYKSKLRTLLRKKFSNWKIKTFSYSSAKKPEEDNILKNNIYKSLDEFIDYQKYSKKNYNEQEGNKYIL